MKRFYRYRICSLFMRRCRTYRITNQRVKEAYHGHCNFGNGFSIDTIILQDKVSYRIVRKNLAFAHLCYYTVRNISNQIFFHIWVLKKLIEHILLSKVPKTLRSSENWNNFLEILYIHQVFSLIYKSYQKNLPNFIKCFQIILVFWSILFEKKGASDAQN